MKPKEDPDEKVVFCLFVLFRFYAQSTEVVVSEQSMVRIKRRRRSVVVQVVVVVVVVVVVEVVVLIVVVVAAVVAVAVEKKRRNRAVSYTHLTLPTRRTV